MIITIEVKEELHEILDIIRAVGMSLILRRAAKKSEGT